jgi:hypothetical protein
MSAVLNVYKDSAPLIKKTNLISVPQKTDTPMPINISGASAVGQQPYTICSNKSRLNIGIAAIILRLLQ